MLNPLNLLSKLIKSSNQWELDKTQKIVTQINNLENDMSKLDDTDFNATNPGVWVHRIHELKSLDKFTDWEQYKSDKPI